MSSGERRKRAPGPPKTKRDRRLCERLQAARKALGKSEETAGRDSGVPLRYLKMFEEGEYPLVADTAYLTPFVRKYAQYLRLDGEEAVREFLHETEPHAELYVPMPSPATPKKTPSVTAQSYAPARPLLHGWVVYSVLAVVGIGAIFAAAAIRENGSAEHAWPESPGPAPERVDVARAPESGNDPEIPDRPREPLEPSSEAQAPSAPSAPAGVAPRAEAPAAPSEPPPSAEPPRSEAEPPAAVAEPARDPSQVVPASAVEQPGSAEEVSGEASRSSAVQADPLPAPPYELRVTATARQVWVWVSVDGGPRRAVSLDRGESVTWNAQQGFLLSTDDAGGVDASLNGAPLPPLGSNARVLRNVHIPSPELPPVG